MPILTRGALCFFTVLPCFPFFWQLHGLAPLPPTGWSLCYDRCGRYCTHKIEKGKATDSNVLSHYTRCTQPLGLQWVTLEQNWDPHLTIHPTFQRPSRHPDSLPGDPTWQWRSSFPCESHMVIFSFWKSFAIAYRGALLVAWGNFVFTVDVFLLWPWTYIGYRKNLTPKNHGLVSFFQRRFQT